MRNSGIGLSGIRDQIAGLLFIVACLLIPETCHSQIVNLPTTNPSATITTGNTFQTVLAAVPKNQTQRHSLTIQNNNTSTDNCWIAFGIGITAGNATTAESIILKPGASYSRFYPYVPSDEIEATCASTSDTLYIDFQ